MTRDFFSKIVGRLVGLVAIAGVVVSSIYLFELIRDELPSKELLLSAASVIVSVLAGAFSVYIARAAKHLRFKTRIFLSYAHDNKEIALLIADALRSKGAVVWFDEEQLKPGTDIFPTIERAIEDSDAFLALLSREPSPSVSKEIELAQANNIPVIAALSGNHQEFFPGVAGAVSIQLRSGAEGVRQLVGTVLDRSRSGRLFL